ncbi:hypothetical protein FB563_3750 [Streptomyces puniciscabiei]|uniref:Secreted protein n=1 Tax=Streptomyces puniciscabiei TaxID=164348 RepID=A0A542UI07_9ACTN|nr:hypothetical protein [Streptomyces puniciscabiei]TQK98711.1 hypothetical protein FB563_3750 [Streptomyces puniciscabiei]
MTKSRNAWRATGVVTALATAAAIASAAPAQAQSTAQLTAWVSDGWGGGTITSRPAGINCHQAAWDDPYGNNAGQPYPTGTCTATFQVGTTVTFTATPDSGSFVNGGPDPNPVTVRTGYNHTWVMFCPNDGLCSAG